MLNLSGRIFAAIKGHLVEFISAPTDPICMTSQAENNMRTEAHKVIRNSPECAKPNPDADSGHLPLPRSFLDLCSAS